MLFNYKTMCRIRTVYRTIPADLQTPVGIYLKIRDLYPQSVLLESSDFHASQNSFSFIGVEPAGRFLVEDGKVTCVYPGGKEEWFDLKSCDAVKILNGYLASFRTKGDNPTGINGLFGYTSYDAVRYFEQVNICSRSEEFKGIPDMLYIFYRFIIVVDHFKNQMTVVENLFQDEESRMEELLGVIHNNNIAQYGFEASDDISSSITDEQYKERVRKGVKHVGRGDVFQIVLSRRFSRSFRGDDFNVYRALRCVNPSPYLFYFDFGGFRIFGSSPETHLRVAKGKAYIDPIAGTFRRTGDDNRDRELAEKLLDDPKENAEHIMLVDLARNDLSRGAGNVKIEFLRQIQYYSHVIHMVSRVSASVSPQTDVLRLFADTFPAGTLSGAPKVRAMQLIDEIEGESRGIYGGSIGYIGFNGDLNQAITIRTFLSMNNKLYFQAGAGIVAASVPESELAEVENKLGALMKAIDYANEIINS